MQQQQNVNLFRPEDLVAQLFAKITNVTLESVQVTWTGTIIYIFSRILSKWGSEVQLDIVCSFLGSSWLKTSDT